VQRTLQYIQYAAYGIGVPLQLMVIAIMLRGAYKRFPFVFAYVIAVFLATAAEIPAYIGFFSGARRSRNVYWINEGVLTVLSFCLVTAFIYTATTAAPNRKPIRRILLAGAVLLPIASVAMHYSPVGYVGQWMTLVSRDLNFCAAVLDLALWSLLLVFRRGDHTLLMLSGALGMQFAGEAIGQSLRQLSRATVWPGNFIIVLANLLCLYSWWQTFRTAPVETTTGAATKIRER
jgi:hypothetical protein